MPYCLSCRNHFETIPEMEWIDCNRMGLCKACGNVSKVKTIMITGLEDGYIASNLRAYAKQREGIKVTLNYRGLFRCNQFHNLEVPDAVIHLAALSGVKQCEDEVNWAVHTNILGTENVVGTCKRHGIPIWTASSFAAIQPENVYGYTKAMAEYLTMRYELGHVFVVSNVYGGLNFEKKSSVISMWAKWTKVNLPIVINGDGSQERDFIHVQDVVRGMIDQVNVALRGGPSYKKYYLCSGVKTSLTELAEAFTKEFKPEKSLMYKRDAHTGIKTPYLIPPMPHCTPRISLREGLHRLHTGYNGYDEGL